MPDTTTALRRHLDGRYADVRDRVRDLLREEGMAPAVALDVDAHRTRVTAQLMALAERGIGPMLGYPTALGGTGDPGAGIAAFQALAFGDLSLLVKAGVQWGLFGGAVLQLGTGRHHERYGADIRAGRLLGCFAMTETGHGSDVQALRTTATWDGEREVFRLDTPDEDARKDYIGNAARDGRMAVVFAQLVVAGEGRGVHALLVPIRGSGMQPLPGVEITDCGHKAGLNGVDNGRIAFSGVEVPREALLDRYGTVGPDGRYDSPIENPTRRFFTMLGALVQGRTSIAGAAVSATQVALAIAIRYADTRRQFGVGDAGPESLLLDYRAHQRVLLPRLAATYALHFAQADLVDRLVDALAGGEEAEGAEARREVESLAAGLKAVATWHCTDTVQACREACGGAGYMSANRLPGLRADTDVFATFEGANAVLLQLVAKGLLTGYAEEFSDLDLLGSVRFAADKVLDVVVERLRAVPLLQSLRGAAPSVGDPDDIRDAGWHCALLADREEHALETAAARLRSGMDAAKSRSGGADAHAVAFEAFNAVQSHLLYAARVHVEDVVHAQFTAAVEQCEDEGARRLLESLRALHALATIEADRGWFLEHGRLTPATSKAVTAAVDRLCGEIRPSAVALVDAFGIPEEALMAPIATGAEAARQELRAAAGRPAG